METVLLPIGDAAEVLDTYYPLFRLQEEGYRVLVAGPEARPYHLVLHERPDGWGITRERPGYTLAAEVAFRNVDPFRPFVPAVTGPVRTPCPGRLLRHEPGPFTSTLGCK